MLWLKRNQILIDSANNQLISSSNIRILKLIVSKTSSQSAFHQLKSSEICKMKWKNLKFMSTIILKRTTNSKSVNWFIESAFIRKQSTQVDFNQHEFIQSSKKKRLINIVMIEVAAYWTLIKKKNVKIFTLIISKINKMLSLIKDSAKLNEMISVNYHVIKETEEEAFNNLSWLSERFWQRKDNSVALASIIWS